jgi:hypothetical protein
VTRLRRPDGSIRRRVIALIIAGVGVVLSAIIYAVVSIEASRLTAPRGLSVSVATNVDQISLGRGVVAGEQSAYWFASSASMLPPPPEGLNACYGRYEWSRRLKGIEAERTLIRVTVSATGSQPVAITGFQVHVLSRRAPAKDGVTADCPGLGSSGPSAVHLVIADLDDNPVAIESYPVGSSKPDPTFTFTLAPGESQVFDLLARSIACLCTWDGSLEVTVGGEEQTVPIEEHSRPFLTTALSGQLVEFRHGHWLGEHIQ